MFSRVVALSSIIALATVAQGGVQIQFAPAYCPGGGTCVAGNCSGGTRNGQTCAPLQYPPSSVVQVDVKLAQTPGGSDQQLRLVEFDMQNTSSFLTVTLPLTHNRGTPGEGDDVNFWSFSSLSACVSQPSFCGFNHYIDDDRPAGPVDTRVNVLSIAYFGLSADGQAQILLPASGTPVTVGKLQVAMPPTSGTFTLHMVNSADTGLDRGARVDFGFPTHIIWRDRPISPDPVAQVTGGSLAFTVGEPPPTGSCCVSGNCSITTQADCSGAWTQGGTCDPNPCPQPTGSCCVSGNCSITTQANCSGAWTLDGTCDPNPCPQPTGSCCVSGNCSVTTQADCSGDWTLDGTCDPNPCPPTVGPSVLKWESVLTHGAVGPVALDIPNTGLFSEPRSGIKKVVVTFDGAINPATAIPANITVCGNNSAGLPVDLTAVAITTATTTGDTKMEINFAPRLPDYARYRIALKTTILGASGGAIQAGTGGLSRILTALQGNAGGGNLIINSADVGGARSLINTDPINPANINHVRSDANNSGNISSADIGGIRSFLNRDAGSIPDPVCP